MPERFPVPRRLRTERIANVNGLIGRRQVGRERRDGEIVPQIDIRVAASNDLVPERDQLPHGRAHGVPGQEEHAGRFSRRPKAAQLLSWCHRRSPNARSAAARQPSTS